MAAVGSAARISHGVSKVVIPETATVIEYKSWYVGRAHLWPWRRRRPQ